MPVSTPAAGTAAALNQLLERLLRDARRQNTEVSGSAGDLFYYRVIDELAVLWAQPPPDAEGGKESAAPGNGRQDGDGPWPGQKNGPAS